MSWRKIYKEIPGVADQLSIAGYSLLGGYAGSNLGFSIIILDPWDERDDAGNERRMAIIEQLQGAIQRRSKRRSCLRLRRRRSTGLGAAGGFQMEVLDQGGAGYAELQDRRPKIWSLPATPSRTDVAQYQRFEPTRRSCLPTSIASKAKTMNVPLANVFGTLQAYLGSAYVNDFTYNNRSYQVRVQAESEFRARRKTSNARCP